MEIDDSKRYVRNPEPVSARMGDELVMLSVDLGRYFHYNESAAWIWKLLECPVTPAEVYAGLRRRFDVSYEECRADARSFLQLLADRDLIREAGEATE